jgi:hypothetical protein
MLELSCRGNECETLLLGCFLTNPDAIRTAVTPLRFTGTACYRLIIY